MNDEYEYEYNAGEHNIRQGETYGQKAYLGPGEDLVITRIEKKTAVLETQYSDIEYTDPDLDNVKVNFDRYNRILIRSWDLGCDPTSTGTLLRFEDPRTNVRSADFRFTLHQRQFSKYLKSNMDRIREEMDAELSGLSPKELEQITRWCGSTDSGSIQLFLIQDRKSMLCAYLGLADQIFIPLNNQWREVVDTAPRYDYQQAINNVSAYTAESIIQQIRGY